MRTKRASDSDVMTEAMCATAGLFSSACIVRCTAGQASSGTLVRAVVVLSCIVTLTADAARLDELEQLPVDTFAKLREVERYQLQVAEKYYIAENWKTAQAEYEKYLQLYERSPAAPYAQLMWSNCLVRQRQVNTAIKEGYRSVIDYWPDSREATVAALLIGRSYKQMGEIKPAKAAYAKLIADYPDDLVAVMAKVDLIDIARVEQDDNRRLELWNDLVHQTKRTKQNNGYCAEAARELAAYWFYRAAFDEGLKSLETTWKDHDLVYRLYERADGPIRHLTGEEKTRDKGVQLADKVVAWIEQRIPADLTDDKVKGRAREYHYWIADLYGASRRGEKVLATYDRIGKLFGEDDDLLDRRAGWLRYHDRRDEARAIYGRFKDQPRGQRAIAYMYREERKYDPAIEIYQRLITADPDRADDYQWAIAECYDESGRLPEAIAGYSQTDRFPDNYMRMAWCHRRLKQFTEALVLYNQAMSVESHAPQAQLEIGFTYEQAEKKEQAIKAFQQVCRRFPQTGQASRAHAHLQNEYKITITLGGAKDE